MRVYEKPNVKIHYRRKLCLSNKHPHCNSCNIIYKFLDFPK